MPIEIDNFERLHEYFSKVVERANHHALDVKEVLYPLFGLVVLHHSPDKPLEVRTVEG